VLSFTVQRYNLTHISVLTIRIVVFSARISVYLRYLRLELIFHGLPIFPATEACHPDGGIRVAVRPYVHPLGFVVAESTADQLVRGCSLRRPFRLLSTPASRVRRAPCSIIPRYHRAKLGSCVDRDEAKSQRTRASEGDDSESDVTSSSLSSGIARGDSSVPRVLGRHSGAT